MGKVRGTLLLMVLAALVFGSMLLAQDSGRRGVVRGTFVRLVEQQVGEQGYLGIVVKPSESDEHVTVLVPRRPEQLAQRVRGLREGQDVEIGFVMDGGRRWARPMEAERREGVEERPEGRRREAVRREVVERREPAQERPEGRRGQAVRREVVERRVGPREGREAGRPLPNLEQAERELREILNAHFGRMARQFRELASRMERMERELQALRAENERLRMQLRQAGGPGREREGDLRGRREGDRPRESAERAEREVRRDPEQRRRGAERAEREVRRDPEQRRDRERPREGEARREADRSLPKGMAGFQGVLVGRIVRMLDRGFVLKVERVANIWEANRADRPEAAVGRELMITIRADEEGGNRFLRTLRTMDVGERVLVEAFHFEGNRLTVVEQLQKSD